MPNNSIIAISIGAALGATLRWWISERLNPLPTSFPLGTLVANLLGGYLIGLVLVGLNRMDNISPECRLAVVTGFLGSLTTFSAFSAEAVILLQQRSYLGATGMCLCHVLGALLATVLGMFSARLIWAG